MPAFLLLSGPVDTSGGGEVFLTVVTGLMFLACLTGELLERSLFFTAVAPARMPGHGE